MIAPRSRGSYWQHHAQKRTYPSLPQPLEVEVAVVGGGITGLTAATALQLAGRQVAVLEMRHIGAGTTGHSTGHLDHHIDGGWRTIIRKFSQQQARQAMQVKKQAIDQVQQWDRQFQLNARFARVPAYLYAASQSDVSDLKKEQQAIERLGGVAQWLEQAPLPFPTYGAIRLPDQGRFSPLQYVQGLARNFSSGGGKIYENVRVQDVTEDEHGCHLATDRHQVRARYAVLATHAPLLGLTSLQTRAYPYQSYVISARVAGQVPDALYWDMDKPYHYTRLADADDPQLIIVGGADHHTGINQARMGDPYAQLETYVYDRYDVQAVEHRWSQEFWESADGLPYIGRLPGKRRIVLGTGYTGDGLTFGTAAGLLMADLVLGRANPAAELFNPSRIKPVASAGRLVSQMSLIASRFIGDRIVSDVDQLQEIPEGEGRIVKLQGQQMAVYHEGAGQFHAMSPVCQHAGCIVHWNTAEKTWDCPCHGGRYDAFGRVIAAPPVHDLEKREIPIRT